MELSDHLNDSALLELIRQDKSYAFRKLYEKYWKDLFIAASRRVDEEIAKDIIQEIMITVWRRRADLYPDKDGSLAGYLHTALKYRIVTHYAYTASEIKKMELFEYPVQMPSEEDLETKELEQLIEREVSKLPSRMQQIFRLSREEDISIREIAGKLNISEQTVKNQLTTALKRLREQLNAKDLSDYALTIALVFYLIKK